MNKAEMQAKIAELSVALCTANTTISTLRVSLEEQKSWTTLWRSKAKNIAPANTEPSARRLAMNAAKEAARASGKATKAEF